MARITAREKLEKAALDLFRQQGYAQTGVDQLIEVAGVSKGSFYHAFPSKEALGLAVLDRYFLQRRKILTDGSYRQIDDPVELALAFLDHTVAKASELWDCGCLMANLSTSVAHSNPAIRERLKALFASSEQELTAMFSPISRAAANHGDSDPPLASDLARQYLCALQGAIVQAQLYQDSDRIRDMVTGFRHYLRNLAGH